jgi:hypothetical protein
MARGDENQPKHSPPGATAKIVLWEQDSHRDVSKANGAGFYQSKYGRVVTAGPHWQSHHIICISSMGSRDVTRIKLEQGLYITDWNINKEPNMIGLPQKCSYGEAEDATLVNPVAGAAKWATVEPTNLPAHNVDHPMYTSEVTTELENKIWSKFDEAKGDHAADAEWLLKKLKKFSEDFQTLLLARATRPPGGTVIAWQQRVALKMGNWEAPFSMAKMPADRNVGIGIGNLTNIFKLM